MTEEIRFIGDLERLVLEPGDKFILSTPRALTVQEQQRIQNAWREFVGGDADALKLLIITEGMTIGAINVKEVAP
jgi:hypothetical protein